MRVLKNILITLGLLIAALAVGTAIQSVSSLNPGDGKAVGNTIWLMVIATGVWAAISSSRLEFRKYKTGMSYHPVTVFLVHLLLWVVVFPWFLTVRDNIKDGTAELKDEFKHEAVPSVAPPVLPRPVQPPVVPLTQPVPPPLPRPQASTEDRFQQLQRLAQLRDQGILSDAEFQSEKQKILGQA